jgi:hypothetical protein
LTEKRTCFKRLILVLLCALFASCSYNEAVNFWNGAETGAVLYAQSKNAKEGILPLNKAGKLEYNLSGAGNSRYNYSLEISYLWRNGADAKGLAVLDLGSLSWELPKDFSFLGNYSPRPEISANDTFLIQYLIPLASGIPEQLTINWTTEDAKSAGNPSFIISSIKLVPRWYGISLNADNNGIKISPFVYSSDNALIIDPPLSLGFNDTALHLEIHLKNSGVVIAEGNEKGSGYFRIEGDARNRLLVPGAFISPASYPLRISGADIIRAELIENASGSGQGQYMASLSSYQVLEPILADPGLILSWPRETFRDTRYEVFRWEGFPSILIFDFVDYQVQDNFLKRLAFYAEKAGFRGRLAADREIANLHGWNAHDYRAETLAAFFDLAASTNFPLLPEEKELEALLFNANIIRSSGGTIVPGEGAIISISRESPEYLRIRFMAHEGFHGLYFTDSGFREFCKQHWDAFAPVPRAFILSYFGYQGYDVNDTDLMINEFMAYILQQPVSQAEYYFGVNIANVIDASPWRRTVLPPKDEASGSWPVLANAFRIEAEAFSRYVNQRWGMAAGRVWTVTFSN